MQGMFTTLPVDLVAAILFATAMTVVTLRYGASPAIALGLSLIVSNVLFAAIPSAFMLGSMLSGVSPFVAAGIYIVMVLVLAFVLYRATSTLSDDSARPLFAIVTGAAVTVIALAVWHITPLQSLWSFNPMIQGVFGDAYRLYWLFVAFVAFAFVKS